jgi:hypothetical protein
MLSIIVALKVFIILKAASITTNIGVLEREVMFLSILAKTRYY